MFWFVVVSMMVCACAELPTVAHCDSKSGCDDKLVYKLQVYFYGHNVTCGELLRKEDTGIDPVVKYLHSEERDRYILLMVDPDDPYLCVIPELSRADYIHYAALMDVEDEFLYSTIDLIPYRGPSPTIGVHRYKIYVYNWPGSGVPVLQSDAKRRARFNRARFEANNRLAPYEAYFEFRVKHVK